MIQTTQHVKSSDQLNITIAEFGLAQPQLVLFKFLRPAHLDEFNLAAYQTENTHEGIR